MRATEVLRCAHVSTPGGHQSATGPCIFISDCQTYLIFSQNYSGCQGKGIGNFSGKATRGVKAEDIGGALIQMWPGAVGAPADTAADTGV